MSKTNPMIVEEDVDVMFRRIRDKISQEIMDMTPEESMEYFSKGVEEHCRRLANLDTSWFDLHAFLNPPKKKRPKRQPILVRVTAKGKHRLEADAQKENISVGALIRKRAIGITSSHTDCSSQ